MATTSGLLQRSCQRITSILFSTNNCYTVRTMSRAGEMGIPKHGHTDQIGREEIGNAGIITLDRPKTLNALTHKMIIKMYREMKQWESNDNIRLVIVKGSGERAFCAGGDVLAVVQSATTGDGRTARQFFYDEYKLNYLIGSYTKPYIALLNGITMGGGVGLSVHGRYRIATEKTVFAMPETAIGLFPDVGGGYFLPRLRGELGMYLALTGDRLNAIDVYHAGVANYYVKSEMVPELEKALTQALDDMVVEKLLRMYSEKSLQQPKKEFSLKPHIPLINKVFAADSVEKILQGLKDDGSEWAMKKHDKIMKMSPTSLKITFEQLRRGKMISLDKVLSMEYRLSQRLVEAKKDFAEGVRAVLVDRDNQPKWDPPTLEQVDKTLIDHYFSPLPADRELDPTQPIDIHPQPPRM